MSEEFTYKDYVSDENFLSEYNAYQSKYMHEIRESDKVLISLIRGFLNRRKDNRNLNLLDIGCSTGNLLVHLSKMFPDVAMAGGDLAESSLSEARENPLLSGVDFKSMDIFDLPEERYDIIIANAVAVYFKWPDYDKSLKSVFKALKPGGAYFVFEWMHPFEHQDIMIYETSVGHPEGIRICFRPIPKVAKSVRRAGFEGAEFYPFEMPFDLSKPAYDQEVVTYTVNTCEDGRYSFRGALSQPWCHMVAHKAK